MHGVQHGPPPPFCPLLAPPADSLLSLRMLQQLVEHLRLLHVGAAAGGGAHRILRYHWLGLQVHGVVAVRRERRRGRHVAHVLRRHGPDHVGICKTSQGRREVRVGGASLPAVRRGRRTCHLRSFTSLFALQVDLGGKTVCTVSKSGAGQRPIR